MSLRFPSSPDDYRECARRRLPRFLFDYLDGGAGTEVTLGANSRDLAAIRLRQRVLVDVENIDTGTQLAGESCSMPVALAPVGMAGIMARRGEAQAARVAESARCRSPFPRWAFVRLRKCVPRATPRSGSSST
jgi:L-lactate dehydrogenase (cytochrome)